MTLPGTVAEGDTTHITDHNAIDTYLRSLPLSVKDYGVQGDGITDDYAAIQVLFDTAPQGSTIFFPAGTYLVSDTLVVSRYINLTGTWSYDPTNLVYYGTIIRPTSSAAQTAMGLEGCLWVRKSYVSIDGLIVKGRSAALAGTCGVRFGYTGVGQEQTHATVARRLFVAQFESGIDLAAGSDHNSFYDCKSAGNQDGVTFRVDNKYDFLFEGCTLEGNTRSSLFLESGANVVNVTCLRTHLGFGQYGVLADTSGGAADAYAGLTLIDSPIEYVSQQHIRANTIRTLHVLGGYWTWNGTPATSPVQVQRFETGVVRLAPRLEPTTANANSPYFVRVTGYTNSQIYIECDPVGAGFSSDDANWGTTLTAKQVWVRGVRFGSEGSTDALTLSDANTDTDVVSVQPKGSGTRTRYAINVFVTVTQVTNLRVQVSYNNGTALQTVDLLADTSKSAGDYSYTFYARAAIFNVVKVIARSSVAGGAVVSASICASL